MSDRWWWLLRVVEDSPWLIMVDINQNWPQKQLWQGKNNPTSFDTTFHDTGKFMVDTMFQDTNVASNVPQIAGSCYTVQPILPEDVEAGFCATGSSMKSRQAGHNFCESNSSLTATFQFLRNISWHSCCSGYSTLHSDCIFLQRKHVDSGLLDLSVVFLEGSIQDPYLS